MAVEYTDDTDVDEVETASGLSDLALMRQEIVEKAAPSFRVPHPDDPRYVLVFNPELSFDTIQNYRKRAKRGKDTNVALVNALIVGGQCTSIEREGKPLTDSEDRPVAFGSKEFLDALGVANRADGVKVFLRGDGFVGQVASVVMEKAGYADEAEALSDDEKNPGVTPTGRV